MSVVTSGDSIFFNDTGTLGNGSPLDLQGKSDVYVKNYSSIANNAFAGLTGMTTITIHASVTSISASAFTGATNLKTIFFYNINNTGPLGIGSAVSFNGPVNVIITGYTSITSNAFAGLTGMTAITIPASVTSIDTNAFTQAINLNTINFSGTGQLLMPVPPSGQTSGPHSLYSAKNVIITGYTSIGSTVFGSGLTAITIPDSVTSIDTTAFTQATNLNTITFSGTGPLLMPVPPSGQTAGPLSLYTAKNVIITGYSSIGSTVFGSGLTAITIPASVTSIAVDTFDQAINLQTVTFSGTGQFGGGTAINYNVYRAKNLIIAGYTSIGDDTFSNASGVTSITISSTVTSIGVNAFMDAVGLSSITIPPSIISIGTEAFKNTTGLTTVFMMPSSLSTFNSKYGLHFIYGPGQDFFGGKNVTISQALTIITVSVQAGWNLIGISMTNASIHSSIDDTGTNNILRIYGNVNDNKGYQLLNIVSLSVVNLVPNMAYWINCLSAGSLYIKGFPPTSNIINIINPGWNLIGTSYAGTLLPGDSGNVAEIYSFSPPVSSPYILEANKGYWIKCSKGSLKIVTA